MFFYYLPKVFFFFCFILLLMSCAICQFAFAENSAGKLSSPIALLVPNSTNIKLNDVGSSGTEKTFESFTSPHLNYVGDVLVVFAQAKSIKSSKMCDIVESYFELTGDSNLDKAFVEGESQKFWKKKNVVKNDENKCRETPTVVVDNKKISVFFNSTDSTGTKFEYEVIGGDVKDKPGLITWKDPSKSLEDQLQILPENAQTGISVVIGGPGIVIKDSLVAPVLYKKTDNDDRFASIIKRKSNTEEKWHLVVNERSPKGMHPAVVEWGDKLIMMIFSSDGYRKVYESADTGVKWEEASGSLSGVWGNTKERAKKDYGGQWGFIMADVGEKGKEKKEIILVTQPVWIESEKYKLHLWMTDNKRVHDVGAISIEVGQNISSTLLHAKDNLFVAYEKWDNGNSTIYAVELKEQLSNVKKMFDKWTEQDTFLSRSCFADDLTLKSDDTCTKNKISTDGLVGFLSGSYSNGDWTDEYQCVSAVVKSNQNKVQNVTKGLKFNGAGATWPVSQQGQNQRYYFTNYNFTLLATVKIDSEATENKNSILGIGLGGSSKKRSIGLWCNNGKWNVIYKKDTAEETVTEKPCVKEGIYQVALILDDNEFSVYIGKEKVNGLPDNIINSQGQERITHFYFGVDSEGQDSHDTTDESHVTVTNVLLYNRPFDNEEIKKLKEYVKPVEQAKSHDEHTTTTAQGGEQTPTQPPDLDEGKEEKKVSSPTRTEDGGVGGGVRVFSLLLPLLCVSAPLLHL